MNDTKKIAIGAYHRGFALKEFLIKHTDINDITIEWRDVGTVDNDRSDYPLCAIRAVAAIREGAAECAVLMCGTGVGMAITANRYPGIFAGVAWNPEIARKGKEDDNINVLVLPSDFVTHDDALAMLNVWLKAEFKKGRYQDRLDMIRKISL